MSRSNLHSMMPSSARSGPGRGTRARAGSAALLALLLPSLLVLSGCLSGSSGLPPKLPLPIIAVLTITNAVQLPPGTQGVTYSDTINFTGGTAPYACVSATGVAGLTLQPTVTPTANGGSCVLSGIPTMAGTFTVVFDITDGSNPPENTLGQSFTITIASPFGTVFTPGSGEVGVAYSQTFTYTGGQGALTSCTLAPLPPGATAGSVTFTGSTCTIAFTPSATFGPTTVTLTAQDSGNPPSTPKSTSTEMASLTIFAHVAVAFSAGTPGVGEAGQAYSLSVPTTGGVPPIANCLFTGLPAGTGLTMSMVVGTNCVLSGTPTAADAAASPITLTVKATDSAANPPNTTAPVTATTSAALNIHAALAVPGFAPGQGEQGANYTLTIPTTGGILPLAAGSCMVTGLPAGTGLTTVTTSSPNCVLMGTPTAADVTASPISLVVTAMDSGDPGTSTPPATATNAAGSINVTIQPPLAIAGFASASGEVGASFSLKVPTTGGLLPLAAGSCKVVGLPAGTGLTTVTTSSPNCVLSGTPTAADQGAQPLSLTFSATDSGDAATATPAVTASNATPVTVPIAAALTVPPFTPGVGEVGQTYTLSVPTTGGVLPIASCLFTGLPVGTG